LENLSFVKIIKAWTQTSRLPFLSVGVMPFILSTVLAFRIHHTLHIPIFLLSVLAVIAILLATYYNGEYYDIDEDRLSAQIGKSMFAGAAVDVL
jgi:1,4-dihydroxy-2-naphthoate octaprenyltransferase